jgi:hypothetical protein
VAISQTLVNGLIGFVLKAILSLSINTALFFAGDNDGVGAGLPAAPEALSVSEARFEFDLSFVSAEVEVALLSVLKLLPVSEALLELDSLFAEVGVSELFSFLFAEVGVDELLSSFCVTSLALVSPLPLAFLSSLHEVSEMPNKTNATRIAILVCLHVFLLRIFTSLMFFSLYLDIFCKLKIAKSCLFISTKTLNGPLPTSLARFTGYDRLGLITNNFSRVCKVAGSTHLKKEGKKTLKLRHNLSV